MMISGLGSPSSMIEYQSRSNLPASGLQGHQASLRRQDNIVFSTGFHQQLLSPQRPPARALDSFGQNFGTSTPTITSTMASSPPFLQIPQRRLSLVANTTSAPATYEPFEASSGTSNTGLLSTATPMDGTETESYNGIPPLEPLLNEEAAETIHTMNYHSLASTGSIFSLPHTSFLPSTIGNSSLILQNVDSTRDPVEDSEVPFQASVVSNNSAAAETIARHRQRAAQAAREAEEAEAISSRENQSASERQKNRSSSARKTKERTQRMTAIRLSSDNVSSLTQTSSDSLPSAVMSRKRSTEQSNDNATSISEIVDPSVIEDTRIDSPIILHMSPHAPKKKSRATLSSLKSVPVEDFLDASDDVMKDTCPICMCEPSKEELSTISGCKHIFCFTCIGKWADRENSCPLCKARFSRVSRVHHQRRKKNGPSFQNIKKVKQRDQRSDIVTGAALEGLLASFAANNGMPQGLRGRFVMAARMGGGLFPLLQQHHNQNSHAGVRSATNQSVFALDSIMNTGDSSSEEDDVFGSTAFPGIWDMIQPGRMRHYQVEHAPFQSLAQPQRMQQIYSFPFSSHATISLPTNSLTATAASTQGTTATPSSSHYDATSSQFTAPSGSSSMQSTYHSYNLRSYASNSNDPNAGHEPNNPLEICDDDDDDSDDSVQVVQVMATTTSM